MVFKKPKGIKYTDMAIYIDEHIYKEDKNEDLIYQYIYHLCYVLACKGKYFKNFQDYDDFAIFAASKVYMRLVDKRQFNPEPGERKLDVIKSVLNYIKLTLYGMKVDYQKDTYKQIIDPRLNDKIDIDKLKYSFKEQIENNYWFDLQKNIFDDLNELPDIIKDIVSKTPYKDDKIITKRLYISCLITILKSITLSNNNQERLRKRELKNSDTEDLLYKLYQEEKQDSLTLWRLDESMSNYVNILCNKIRKNIASRLMDTKKSYEITEEMMEAIMLSSFKESMEDKYYD